MLPPTDLVRVHETPLKHIKENEIQRGTPSLLRGLDANGNSILASIASVQNIPFRGNLSNTDINTVTTSGFYYLATDNRNCPYESYSYLLVINLVGDAIQFNMHNGSGGIQYRKQYGGAWRNWRVIASEG